MYLLEVSWFSRLVNIGVHPETFIRTQHWSYPIPFEVNMSFTIDIHESQAGPMPSAF